MVSRNPNFQDFVVNKNECCSRQSDWLKIRENCEFKIGNLFTTPLFRCSAQMIRNTFKIYLNKYIVSKQTKIKLISRSAH